jgi:TolB protein
MLIGCVLGVAALGVLVPPAAPPDGGYAVVFYSHRDANKEVYLLDPGETEPRNLTRHPAQDLCPAAAPDGKRIAFLSDRGGNVDIYSMGIDGGDVRRLTASPEAEEHPEFTPDGKRILFVRDFGERTEIWVMNADGTEPRRLTKNDARDERPMLSPDGTSPVRLTHHPAWDGWASFVPTRRPE